MLRYIRNTYKKSTKEVKYLEWGWKNNRPTSFFYYGEFPDGRCLLSIVILNGSDNFKAAILVSKDEKTIAEIMTTSFFDLENFVEANKDSL